MTNANARALVTEIFKYVDSRKLDSEEVMLAMVDVIAAVAVTLDLSPDANSKCSLNDRIDSLVEMIRLRYPEVLAEMITRN